MIRLCIFDLDGTLADTLGSIAGFANQALRRCGWGEIPLEEYRYLVGNGADQLMRGMLKRAAGSFSDRHREDHLKVEFPKALLEKVPEELRAALIGVLSQDPRPSYQNDPERVYGMTFAGLEVKFSVEDKTLHVRKVEY